MLTTVPSPGRGLHVLDGRRQPEAVEPGDSAGSRSLSLARLLASSSPIIAGPFRPRSPGGLLSTGRGAGGLVATVEGVGATPLLGRPIRRARRGDPLRSVRVSNALVTRTAAAAPGPAMQSGSWLSRSRRRHRGASASCVYAAVGPSPVNCAQVVRRSVGIQRLICEKRALGHSYPTPARRICPIPAFGSRAPATTRQRARATAARNPASRRESTSLPPQSDRSDWNSSNLAYNALQDSAESHPGSDDRPGPPARPVDRIYASLSLVVSPSLSEPSHECAAAVNNVMANRDGRRCCATACAQWLRLFESAKRSRL